MEDNYKTTLSVSVETGEKLKWLAKDDDRAIAAYLRRFVTAYVNSEYERKHPKSESQIGLTEPEVENHDIVAPSDRAKEKNPKAQDKIQESTYTKIDKEWSSDMPKVKF